MKFSNQSVLRKMILTAGLAVSASFAAQGASYGDFSDVPPGTIVYTDVSESSFTNVGPLYGEPTITGDLLDFDPEGFGASSSNGNSDLTDGQINFTLDPIDGSAVTSFTITEGGDIGFTGLVADPGTFASARIAAIVSILEVDGTTLGTPIDLFASATYFIDYATVGDPPVPALQPWSLTLTVDLTGALPQGFNLGATLVEVAIDNQLTTTTTAGNTAAIAKKDFRVNSDTVAVPEPTSLALLGLGGLLMARRRRDR